ncbi:hypothetical protein [Candidatus Poriferisocius sp.]|uniref:hypothetical protein n=1 Tax=Candidatus Poriferisocius sp. TaxID=3101276 RepID=UPI003B01F282
MALVASVLIWAAPGSQAQTPPNIPPVAIGVLGAATPNDNGTATDPTDDYVVQALTGDRSFDPDAASGAANNGIAQFRWEVVTDTYKDWLAITNPNAANASFIVPNDASIARYGQTIEFRLTVWDADPRTSVGALSDSDTVTYNFRAAESPTADITITALLPNPTAVENYDDDGDGMVDEDDEQFTVDAIISRPGEGDNSDYEWHIKEGALLTIDGSGSSDPDTRLTDANFTWTRVYDSSEDTGVSTNAGAVDDTLPGGTDAEGAGATGMKISSHTPAADGTPEALSPTNLRIVAPLYNDDGSGPQPFFSYYRLTIDDNGATDGGNTDTADVLIVIHDQPNDPVAGTRAAPITVTADGPDADTDADDGAVVESKLGPNRYLVEPNHTVTITAMPFDADIGAAGGSTGLLTSFEGARPTAQGATSATLMIPRTAPQGTEYEVNITITDNLGTPMRSSTTTVTIVAVRNSAPEAVAPETITVGDGPNGGTIGAFNLPTGQVMLRGIGFDADGDDLAFTWTELAYPLVDPEPATGPALNTDGTPAAIRLPRKPYLSIDNADQETASFSVPEVDSVNLPIAQINHDGDDGTTPAINGYAIPVSFTVTDSWGESTTGMVIVNIYDNEQYATVANAGANQQVSSGGFVRLNGSGSSPSNPTTQQLDYLWTYTGITTDPATQDRPAITPQEMREGYREGVWFPYDGLTEPTDGSDPATTTDDDDTVAGDQGRGSYHPTAGGELKQQTTRFPYFDAPSLHGFNSIKLHFSLLVFVDANDNDTADDGEEQNTARVTITVSDGYYSGIITGPDFCTGYSLGGPQTFAFDSNGDGVADICSLKTTRREAVATQNALNELAALFPETFKDHLHGMPVEDDDTTADVDESEQSIASQCASAPKNLGDSDAALNADACGPAGTFARRVSSPPAPVDPSVRDVFFSGIVSDENFCTNLSLGGQPLYAFDSDGDGVADICSLGYTRREAVARQNALQAGFLEHDQFAAALARACAELGTTDFGDSAGHLAADRCSNPRPSTPGTALPTATN